MQKHSKNPKNTYIVKIHSGTGKSIKDVIKEIIKDEISRKHIKNGEGYEIR